MHAVDSGISLTVLLDLAGTSRDTSTSLTEGGLELTRFGLKVGFVFGFNVVVWFCAGADVEAWVGGRLVVDVNISVRYGDTPLEI